MGQLQDAIRRGGIIGMVPISFLSRTHYIQRQGNDATLLYHSSSCISPLLVHFNPSFPTSILSDKKHFNNVLLHFSRHSSLSCSFKHPTTHPTARESNPKIHITSAENPKDTKRLRDLQMPRYRRTATLLLNLLIEIGPKKSGPPRRCI